MTSTERLSLPYIVQSQSQKEVTHNDGLNLLDMMVQAVVLEVELDTPPASPTLGDCYVIGNSPTGDWTTHADELCQAITGGWRFISPFEGLLVYNLSDDLGYRYDGSSWNSEAISELQNLSLLGVNASADATNKLAVASSAVLFNNIGNGIQVKLNKASTGDSASFLYQTNWSGRAEFGTTGDDDFHIKVSPDGSNWFEALVVDKDTGDTVFKRNLTIAEDSGNSTLDLKSVDGVSDPRFRIIDSGGKQRVQQFYDISAHLWRVYTYDSAGVSEGEVYRFGNAGFNINPNNDPNIDLSIEVAAGIGLFVDASANAITVNPSANDIDFFAETLNGTALHINAGANLVHFNHTNADINFRIDTMNVDAAFLVDADTDKADFNVPVDFNSGLSFDGGSNVLENYEEGTWTPTIYGATTSGTPTYYAQLGRYVRIGNLVWVNFRLVASLAGADGQLRIGGLPFILSSAAGAGSRTSTAIGFRSGLSLPAGYQDIQGIAYNGTDDIYMQKFSATGATSLLASEIGTLTLYATLTYEV